MFIVNKSFFNSFGIDFGSNFSFAKTLFFGMKPKEETEETFETFETLRWLKTSSRYADHVRPEDDF